MLSARAASSTFQPDQLFQGLGAAGSVEVSPLEGNFPAVYQESIPALRGKDAPEAHREHAFMSVYKQVKGV